MDYIRVTAAQLEKIKTGNTAVLAASSLLWKSLGAGTTSAVSCSILPHWKMK